MPEDKTAIAITFLISIAMAYPASKLGDRLTRGRKMPSWFERKIYGALFALMFFSAFGIGMLIYKLWSDQ